MFGPVRSVLLEVRVCALACFVSSSYGVLYDLCPVASGLDLVVGTCRFCGCGCVYGLGCG